MPRQEKPELISLGAQLSALTILGPNPSSTAASNSFTSSGRSTSGSASHSKSGSSITISRRPTHPVNWDEVVKLYPHLSGIPPEYVREKVRATGSSLLKVLCETNVFYHGPTSKQQLPTHLGISLSSVSAPAPTHVLAIPSKGKDAPPRTSMHPVYALVIVAYCAGVSPLRFADHVGNTVPPLLSPTSSRSPNTTVMLPIVPLQVPEPYFFRLLHFYLYTGDLASLLQPLISSPRTFCPLLTDPTNRNEALGYLERTHSIQTISRASDNITRFRLNMEALQVCDDALWDFIEQLWDLISSALRALRAVR